ncbi:MAG: hypothetical protein U0694_24545 [Anaerolineae bacterium]
MSKRMLRISGKVYRVLLRLYPAEHREAFGAAMAQTFGDMLRDAYGQRGARGVLRLWLETLSDTLQNAVIEHGSVLQERLAMSRRSLMVLGLALLLAVVTGYVDITADEVQAPMLCILLFSFMLGLLQPKGAWRWALLIGLSIPAATFVGLAINFNFVDAPPRYPITLAVLVIPALVAAYLGVLASRAFTTMRQTA